VISLFYSGRVHGARHGISVDAGYQLFCSDIYSYSLKVASYLAWFTQ